MSPTGFKPSVAASKRSQTPRLRRTTIGIGQYIIYLEQKRQL